MSKLNLLIVGSSTGGPLALNKIFSTLNPINAAVVIVQHLPDYITDSIATSIRGYSKFDVEIAQTDMKLEAGKIFLAPGGKHLKIEPSFNLKVFDGEEVNFVKPSVDVAMLSIQSGMFDRIVAVILTGMGRDGANGIEHLKKLGAVTMAQCKESCSVFGMPKAAIETKCIDWVLSPESIASKIQEFFDPPRL